jgi:preprotein translocase subunit SecD
MNKNLLWKLLFIVGTMLFFLFGIFGIPKSLSGQGLLTALTDHIHLSLDLKGGTHLILQVQVNYAVNVDAQNAIEVLKEQSAATRSTTPTFPSPIRRIIPTIWRSRACRQRRAATCVP